MIHVRFSLTILVLALFCASVTAQERVTSASRVKASANATKVDKDGKQVVTITLDIEKGWLIYANLVGEELLEPSRTRITFKAEEAVTADVKYPIGRAIVEKNRQEKFTCHVYEGQLTIVANVQRKVSDASPLLIEICMHGSGFGMV